MTLYQVEISDNIQKFKNTINVLANNEDEAKKKVYANYDKFVDDSFNSTYEVKVLTIKILSIKPLGYVDIL